MAHYTPSRLEADLLECSECGHQHFNGREYLVCPLTSEGCACPVNPTDIKR